MNRARAVALRGISIEDEARLVELVDELAERDYLPAHRLTNGRPFDVDLALRCGVPLLRIGRARFWDPQTVAMGCPAPIAMPLAVERSFGLHLATTNIEPIRPFDEWAAFCPMGHTGIRHRGYDGLGPGWSFSEIAPPWFPRWYAVLGKFAPPASFASFWADSTRPAAIVSALVLSEELRAALLAVEALDGSPTSVLRFVEGIAQSK